MVFNVALSAYLIVAAAWDLKRGIVPNWLTVPALAFAGGWQLYQGQWEFLQSWAAIFTLWMLRFFGGGDAKLMMALFALFPGVDFLVAFCWVAVAATLPQIVLKYWRTSPLVVARRLGFRLATGLLPGEGELEESGVRSTWIISLAGMLYVWFLAR